MIGFVHGAELMVKLFPFLGSTRSLRVCFGLQRHCVVVFEMVELESMRLIDVDKVTINPNQKKLTLDHLNELVEKMKTLQSHTVFSSGRSFFQEGTFIYDDEHEVLVVFSWGS